jgi:hypothetical protein
MATQDDVNYAKLFADHCKLRAAKLEREADEFFEMLSHFLGAREAKRIFTEVTKRAPRRRKGAHNPARDRELLRLHDKTLSHEGTVLGLARALDRHAPGRFGPKGKPLAIYKQLRRLLARRSEIEDFVNSSIE